MSNLLCHTGAWGSLGSSGGWGWAGWIAGGILWIGLLAGLTLLVVYAIRRARVPSAVVSYATGQPSVAGQNAAKEILQAQYARGEITREQYHQKKQDVE